MAVLFPPEGPNQFWAMAGVGHLRPYAAWSATGCRAPTPGLPAFAPERGGSTLSANPWPRRRMVGSTRKRAFGYARRAADLRVSAPARPGAVLLHAPIAARPQRMSETGKRLTPACIPDWPAASSARPA